MPPALVLGRKKSKTRSVQSTLRKARAGHKTNMLNTTVFNIRKPSHPPRGKEAMTKGDPETEAKHDSLCRSRKSEVGQRTNVSSIVYQTPHTQRQSRAFSLIQKRRRLLNGDVGQVKAGRRFALVVALWRWTYRPYQTEWFEAKPVVAG